MDLRELERRAQLDPADTRARIELLAARARVEGAGVYLEVLAGRERWNAATELERDAAIAEVEQRLGGGFDLSVGIWECENASRGENEVSIRSRVFSHRLATFTHIATGIEFQLLPGKESPGYLACECYNHPHENHLEGKSCPYCCSNCKKNKEVIKPFLIARWPVTREQSAVLFDWCRTFTGMVPDPVTASALPATGHRWEDTKSALATHKMRLPIAEEWEYACSAGTSTRYYWGDEFDPSHVWYSGNSGERREGVLLYELSMSGRPHAPDGCHGWHRGKGLPGCPRRMHHHHDERCRAGNPRSHSPKEHDDAGKYNAFGLVDMIGNVWEMVGDGGVRGGSWGSIRESLLLPWGDDGGYPQNEIGFRPAMSVPGIES